MPLQATSGAASYDAFGGGVAAVPNYIEDVFSTWLYRGNGSTQTITNNIDLSTKGGMVWIKSRDNTNGHRLTDTSRGVTKSLESNSTNAEATESTGLTAFNTTGFTIGADADYNANAYNFSSWTFRKQPKFFDVVTYSGSASSQTINHSLGSTPACIIIKKTNGATYWYVWHRGIHSTTSETNALYLNTTDANGAVGMTWISNITSTSFTLGVDGDFNNTGGTYVAYIYAHNAGGFGLTGTDNVISCGSFTTDANGQASVTLGYEPQWLLWKNTSAVENWVCVDNMRGLSRTEYKGLRPNLTSGTEFSNTVADALFPTATGFATGNGTASAFKESNTYIYIAIRRGPMKVPTSGTSVFAPFFGDDTSGYTTNFASDMLFDFPQVSNASKTAVLSRLTGGLKGLITSSTGIETTGVGSSAGLWASNTTIAPSIFGANTGTQVFKRAPSFFDVVCYTGTSVANTQVTHNLGVQPELIIVKARTAATNWDVLHTPTSYRLNLNTTGAGSTPPPAIVFGNDTTYVAPTASYFVLGTNGTVNSSANTYVAYLFATCAGVSKVGSYTGTGTTLQVDCGFTGGARFVLIKRVGTTGDWYVWDSARGIVAGNDPYLLLNSTAAEVTNTDYVDTYSAGFEISSTAPAAINASGGTFIFLAIA